jgi:uncharacterized repeat protein (TIGR03803 family)
LQFKRARHKNGSNQNQILFKRDILNPESFMKTCIKKLFLLPALTAALGLTLADRATAQIFTILHNFSVDVFNSSEIYTNSDGAFLVSSLIISGNTLYGTANEGGTGNGTIFAVNTNGTGFTNLHTFSAGGFNNDGFYFPTTNSDGANPVGGLILSGNTLYGTASGGGTNDNGTVFAVNTNGTANGTSFTNLYILSPHLTAPTATELIRIAY